MNIPGPKRTARIDAQRERLLGYNTAGGPIWTEVGGPVLTGDEKYELAHNIAAQQRHAAVAKIVQNIKRGAASFFEHSVMEVAPEDLNEHTLGPWLMQSGFTYKQDGLKSVLLHCGTEVGSMTAKCDPLLVEDVLLMLKFEYTIEKAKQ